MNIIGKYIIDNSVVLKIISFEMVHEELIEVTAKMNKSSYEAKALIYEKEAFEKEIDAFRALVEDLESNLEWAKSKIKRLEDNEGENK